MVHHQTRRKQNLSVNGFVAESPFQEHKQGAVRLANGMPDDTILNIFLYKENTILEVVHHQGLEPGTP